MNEGGPMRLHVLGGGCPQPTPERYGSSFILEVGADPVMVDCGPGTTCKMARMGIMPNQVGHVFLTHHHFDHNVDLPCLALTRWDLSKGAEPPLEVYGPPPTHAFGHKFQITDSLKANGSVNPTRPVHERVRESL